MVWFWGCRALSSSSRITPYFHETACRPTDRHAYFSDNGLEINAAVQALIFWKTVLPATLALATAMRRNDCYWEVIKHSDQSRRHPRMSVRPSAVYIRAPSVLLRRTSPAPTASSTTTTPACGSPRHRLRQRQPARRQLRYPSIIAATNTSSNSSRPTGSTTSADWAMVLTKATWSTCRRLLAGWSSPPCTARRL